MSKWQLNDTPTLRLPFGVPELPVLGRFVPPRLALTTAFDVFYKSDMFLDLDLDPNTRQRGHVLLDGRIAVSTLEDTLSIGVSVSNLTDADVFEYVTDSTFFPGGYMAFQEFQRNYAAEVRYRF